MDSVRSIFFIFFALLVSIDLISNPVRIIRTTKAPAAFSIFEENGKVGLKNEHGQVVIPAQYEAIGWSNGQFSMIGNVTGYRSKGLWGLINTQNSKVTKAQFEDLSPGQGETLVGRKKLPGTVTVRSGCINLYGKEVVPFIYDGIEVKDFRAIVYLKAGNQFKHGLITLENKILIPVLYQRIYSLGSLRYGVENFQNKHAIFTEDGKQLTDFIIDSLSAFKGDYAVLYQEQKQGLIDRNGQIKIAPAYGQILLNDDGSVKTRVSDLWLVLDESNNAVRQINADSVVSVGQGLVKICAGGKAQLADKKFRPLTAEWFTSLDPFKNNLATFKLNQRVGLLNKEGQILIKPLYQNLTVDHDRVIAQIVTDKRFVLIDTTGGAITPRSYDAIRPFNGNFFPVLNRGYWGAINTFGKEIVACTHDSIGQIMEDMMVVKFKGKYGVVNLKEEWLVTPQPGKIELISHERYLQRTAKTKFLKTLQGEVIYFSDNEIFHKNGFLIELLQSGSYLKIDMGGRIIERFEQPASVETLFEENEGLRPIKKDGRYGFVDSRGRLRIANRYENVKAFSETLAPAMIRGKWGFINHEDQIAIQPVYDHVEAFSNGFAIVRQKEYYGLIDKKGKVVLPVKYESIQVLRDNLVKVKQSGMWGLLDTSGKILLHTKFDKLTALDNGFAITSKDNKFGVLTLEGMSRIPEIYDSISYDKSEKQFLAVKRSEWRTVTLK